MVCRGTNLPLSVLQPITRDQSPVIIFFSDGTTVQFLFMFSQQFASYADTLYVCRPSPKLEGQSTVFTIPGGRVAHFSPFHKMRGLQWQYSCAARSPHGEVKRLLKAIMGSVTNFPYTGSVIKHNNKMTEEYHKGLRREIKFIIPIKVLMTSKLIMKLIRNYS
jgi:hypothetical protein